MSIKIKQKLGKDSLAKLQEQLKAKGIKVIIHNEDGFVTTSDVIGRVSSVFNLNNEKLDVFTSLDKPKEKGAFKFTQIQDDFYLMQGELH